MLAHVLESQGLATVGLSLVRAHAEKLHPPRALHCEFPLGRPLGRPGDPAFQRRVLTAAFDLLRRDSGPVLEDFPETIRDESAQPEACPLPPRFDPSLPVEVDEALALRPAYERAKARTGRTAVGRVIHADGVRATIEAFLRIAEGVPLDEAGLPGDPRQTSADIRAYYEEAALALLDHVPAARETETWFHRHTATGKMLARAQSALRDAGADFLAWFYVVPIGHEGEEGGEE